MTSEVDLRCGEDPADPSALYRLDMAFDDSGQAYVFRGVEPGSDGRRVTVRVWRPMLGRPEARQHASWRKGSDLLERLRDVEGICRPVADFVGHRPWAPGAEPSGPKVPIQVLEWVDGENLKDRRKPESVQASTQGDLNAHQTLHALARILIDLHRHGPIVHQDVAPSNLIITPKGEVVLIDFTSARDEGDLTHYAGKLEGAAPEVVERISNGVGSWKHAAPGLASDVFGFGSTAYYVLTGRTWRTGWVESLDFVGLTDAIKTHLRRVLADEATERISVYELPEWVDTLADLVANSPYETPGVRWRDAVVPGPRTGDDRTGESSVNPTGESADTDGWGRLSTPEDPWSTGENTQLGRSPFADLPVTRLATHETADARLTEPDEAFLALADLFPSSLAPASAAQAAPPGTTPVIVVPNFLPGPTPLAVPSQWSPGRAAVDPPHLEPPLPITVGGADRPHITDRPQRTFANDVNAGPAAAEATPTLIAAADTDRVGPIERMRLGCDYVLVLAVAAVVAWLVWLLGSSNLTNSDALGSILYFALAAGAADLIGQSVGAIFLQAWSRNRPISFWRGLHALTAAVLITAVTTYAWLLATGN